MDEVIYLEPDDDIITIRDRLEWTDGKRVLVVLPRGSQALASPIAIKLLRRHAESLSKEVAIVARDGETRRLAQAEGIPAFRRVPKRWWRLGRGTQWLRRQESRLQRPPGFPSADNVGRDLVSRWAQLAAFLLLLVLLGALVATLVVVVPVARITLTPRLTPVEVEVPLVADVEATEPNPDEGVVPAREVKARLESVGEIPTSSRHDAPDLPARGKVIFANLTPEDVVVPMGTVVRTSTGTTVRFTTVQTVTVPGPVGGKAEAEIVALNPGPVGNVDKNLINRVEGGLSLRVTVTNEEPTSGGTMKQVGLVTYADKERLRNSVLQQLRQEGLQRLQGLLEPSEFLLAETLDLTVLDEVYDPPLVEVESETLRVVMRAEARALAVAEQAANEMTLHALEAAVEGRGQLLPQRVTFTRGSQVTVDESRQRAAFTMQGRGVTVPEMDLDAVRRAVAGLPLEEARAWMQANLPLAEPPRVTLVPNWLGRIPWLTFRIHLFVEVQEGS
ncbi:MAG: baseplate J/gp47 family protein [Anaerolineae bacterium]|nr:baseplate J/gp47 family protein [Anaerolineae bacterium]